MNLQAIFERGNYSEVIDKWDGNQFQASNDPNSAFILAAAHFRLGNLDKAREVCELIEGPFANNSSFLSMYAAILRRSNLLLRAEEIFKRALSIDPESKEIENNYSNLLIDQGKYDEAIALLNQIVKKHPGYTDAKTNLFRAEAIKQEKLENTLKVEETTDTENIFGDPLDQAFNADEVNRVGGKIGSVTATVGEILSTDEKKDIEEAELEMLRLATDQIKDKQFFGALNILNKLRKQVGSYSAIYKAASDAYIGLERFRDAEINALTAYINEEKTIANFVNLASLAAMRKDQLMAMKWINEAEKLDKNNEMVVQCKKLLFPNGESREEDKPFRTDK